MTDTYIKVGDVVIEIENPVYGTKVWDNPELRPSWMNIPKLYDDKYSFLSNNTPNTKESV